LTKEFIKGTPTCVVWDGVSGVLEVNEEMVKRRRKQEKEIEEEEALWEGMEVAVDEKRGGGKRKSKGQEESGVKEGDSEEETLATRKAKKSRVI